MTKPFSPRELLARVKAVLRRTEAWLDEPELALGDVVVRRDAQGGDASPACPSS